MKNMNSKTALLLGLSIITLSCEETTTVDQVLDEVGTGAVLRTRDEINNLVFDDVEKAFTD
ncbi:MAG: hypothetical protein WBG48_05180, partial [Pricia sp.]